MRRILILCIGILISTLVNAQKISGTVIDSDEKSKVQNALVILLSKPDSIYTKFTRTDKNGGFVLQNFKPGNYVLLVMHARYADYVDDIKVGTNTMDYGVINMIPKAKLLQEVIVRTGGSMRFKGDTISYTADSFKVGPNANVEELLKKLPGIQVDKDGKITAMGEQVRKVLVDGEEFFGSDPGMVAKNLRADAVKEVQVFDKKSEQAEFTGIDDGQKTKTINLKLKEDKKKGYFGRAEIAGGLKDNYNNQLMLNAFKGKRKFSVYGLMGTVGKSSLGWTDEQNYGGGEGFSTGFDEDDGGVFMMFSREDDQDFSIGFPRNKNAGLHYSNKFTDKHNLNSSYTLNDIDIRTGFTSYSRNIIPGVTWNQNNTESKRSQRTQHKGNLTYEWKIDSANTLKITAKTMLTKLKSDAFTTSDRFTDSKSGIENPLNKINDDLTGNANITVLFKHKFKKPKRTLSWNTELGYNETENKNYLIGSNRYFTNGVLDSIRNIDQFRTIDLYNRNINSKLSYTEPLSKTFYLELNVALKAAASNNNTNTLASSNFGKYDSLVTILSNHFDQTITTQQGGLNFRYVKKKVNFSFGGDVAFARFLLKDLTRKKDYDYPFTNFFPKATLNFNFKPTRQLRFNYNGSTKQPSINQLQPLFENNDPLNLYVGNPNLKQSFTHNFSLFFFDYNFLKEKQIFLNMNASVIQNAFSNSVVYNAAGQAIRQPVNVNGVMNLMLFTGFGIKFKKSGIRLWTGPTLNLYKNVDFQNNAKNNSTNFSLGYDFVLSKEVSKKYSVSLNQNLSYNRNKSSLRPDEKIQYFVYTLNTDLTIYLPKKFRLNTDGNWNVRQRTSNFDRNTNNFIWNASLSKDLFKEKFVIAFSINDILNQNNGFSRVATSNFYNETIRQRLQRYWLVSFTWHFSKNGKPMSGFGN